MQRLNENKARRKIKRALGSIAAALLCVAALGEPNLAYAAHGGGGGFHGGGFGGLHGGGFHGGGFHAGGFGGFHGGAVHGSFAGVHNGFAHANVGHWDHAWHNGAHWDHGWNNGRYGWWWGADGLGWTYYPYVYGWDSYPDYGYYGYSQPN